MQELYSNSTKNYYRLQILVNKALRLHFFHVPDLHVTLESMFQVFILSEDLLLFVQLGYQVTPISPVRTLNVIFQPIISPPIVSIAYHVLSQYTYCQVTK